MAVYRLDDEEIWFPYTSLGEEDGLLAVGGDLSLDRLVLAYENGIFPWYSKDEPILWWCPKKRFIIKPGNVHISKSMKKFLKNDFIEVTFNGNFKSVIGKCKEIRENKEGTWITDEMKNAYVSLYEKGFASSVEVYYNKKLVGGLYGVSIGKCFFGESMFSLEKNASKVALIKICEKLENEGFLFLDCQMHTNHLESMGGERITLDEFNILLKEGIEY